MAAAAKGLFALITNPPNMAAQRNAVRRDISLFDIGRSRRTIVNRRSQVVQPMLERHKI
jgi:hypothetical protein